MKKLIYLFLIVSVAFISCDGRDRKHKTDTPNTNGNKNLDSYSESIYFHPEEYSEVTTDTILTNGFQIKIKTVTDMNNAVLQQKDKDSLKYKHYFRKLVSHVSITKGSKEIFNNPVDASFLKHFDEINDLDIKSAIISASLDESSELKTDDVVILCMIYLPKPNKLNLYNLIINKSGNYTIESV